MIKECVMSEVINREGYILTLKTEVNRYNEIIYNIKIENKNLVAIRNVSAIDQNSLLKDVDKIDVQLTKVSRKDNESGILDLATKARNEELFKEETDKNHRALRFKVKDINEINNEKLATEIFNTIKIYCKRNIPSNIDIVTLIKSILSRRKNYDS